ncbi:hypothetical protein [Cryptosporangium phraense]|uniref:hypothetical protein n=1 Tax=Cryptosporangium phraense TaxID=2593070 RepID=UPI001478D519|nr:hypothetical protein [Cryptosporangium phraense]
MTTFDGIRRWIRADPDALGPGSAPPGTGLATRTAAGNLGAAAPTVRTCRFSRGS